ncbi:MAG: hypothetical protein ABIS27_06340 [Longimicrobiales bacterium]
MGASPIQAPVTSLILAGVLYFFPDGFVALNALTPLLILASLAFAFALLRREGRQLQALLAVMLSLASVHVYHATTQILSEPAYMFLSLAALLTIETSTAKFDASGADQSAGRRKSISGALLAGSLMVAAVMTRTIGIALALAVLLVEAKSLVDKRRSPRLLLGSLAILALVAVVLWDAYTSWAYVGVLFRALFRNDPWLPDSGHLSLVGLVARMRDNLHLLPAAGAMLIEQLSTRRPKLDFLLQVVTTLSFVSGLVIVLRRRLSVTGLYVALYVLIVAVHMVAGGYDEIRFMVPVAPFVFFYTIEAARHLVEYVKSRETSGWPAKMLLAAGAGYVIAFTGGGMLYATAGVRDAHQSPFGDYPIKRPSNYDAERMALWLKAHSGPDERYAAAQKDMFDVITERRGYDIHPGQTTPRDAFVAWLHQERVRYILIDRTGLVVGDSLLAVARDYPSVFRLAAELPGASIYEVRQEH